MADHETIAHLPPSLSLSFQKSPGQQDWQLSEIQANHAEYIWIQKPRTARWQDGALCAKLCDTVASVLLSIHSPGTRSFPEIRVELPNLKLSRLAVHTRYVPNGDLCAVVRFASAQGDTKTALASVDASRSMHSEREELATRVLLDLVQPCLDLATASDLPQTPEHFDMVQARLTALSRNRAELEMLAGLLQSFVALPGDASPRQAALRSGN